MHCGDCFVVLSCVRISYRSVAWRHSCLYFSTGVRVDMVVPLLVHSLVMNQIQNLIVAIKHFIQQELGV